MLAAGLGVVATLGVVAVLVLHRRQRDAARRVARAAARLDGRSPTLGGGLREHLVALDRSVAVVSERAGDVVASERLVRALDAIPQGVVICDGRGGVVFENEVGAGFSRARHGDALVSAAVTELLAAAVAGSAASRNLELYGPPRRTLVIDAYPLPSETDQQVSGALAVIEDVSERRRLELVRRDFVANISHELKTPVGALALLAETLLAARDRVDRERLTRRMLDEAHRVGHTIDDLLSLSRIEADQEADWPPVQAAAVIEEAVARSASAAEQRGIRVETAASDDLVVLGDSRQLVSAVFNLLDNAVKYSDPGLSVHVMARRVGPWVDWVVADRGPGIPTRDLERIFERFYRVDRARSRQTGGTGLGLAIVRHVASNHGGDVTVESREGEGSTFILRVPALQSASAVPSTGTRAPTNIERTSV